MSEEKSVRLVAIEMVNGVTYIGKLDTKADPNPSRVITDVVVVPTNFDKDTILAPLRIRSVRRLKEDYRKIHEEQFEETENQSLTIYKNKEGGWRHAVAIWYLD